VLQDGKFPYYVNLYGLDKQSLQAYAASIGVDAAQLLDPESLSAIVIETVPYQDDVAGKYVEMQTIHTKVGASIPLHGMDWDTEQEIELGAVKVAALTDQLPIGVFPAGLGGVDLIVS